MTTPATPATEAERRLDAPFWHSAHGECSDNDICPPVSADQPATAAGRSLVAQFDVGQFGRVLRLVLAIEAEARATALRDEPDDTALLAKLRRVDELNADAGRAAEGPGTPCVGKHVWMASKMADRLVGLTEDGDATYEPQPVTSKKCLSCGMDGLAAASEEAAPAAPVDRSEAT